MESKDPNTRKTSSVGAVWCSSEEENENEAEAEADIAAKILEERIAFHHHEDAEATAGDDHDELESALSCAVKPPPVADYEDVEAATGGTPSSPSSTVGGPPSKDTKMQPKVKTSTIIEDARFLHEQQIEAHSLQKQMEDLIVDSTPGAVAVGGMSLDDGSIVLENEDEDPHPQLSTETPRLPSGVPTPSPTTSSRDVTLAVAKPVEADSASQLPLGFLEEADAPEKTTRRPQKECWSRRGPLIAIGLVLIVAFATIVSVTILLLQGRNEKSSGEEGDLSKGALADQSPEEYLVSLLPEFTLRQLEDVESPQAKAFEWLRGDPGLRLGSYSSRRVLQRFALATLYFSTGGDSSSGWIRSDNWLSYEHHECSWYMKDPKDAFLTLYHPPNLDNSICSGESSDEYQIIALPSNQLRGTLPPEISLMTTLKAFTFRNNELRGTLPSQIANLSSLLILGVTHNAITGSLPSELGSMENLFGIFTFLNRLSGTIPTQVAQMPQLKHFHAESNMISGPLPTQLGSSKSLESIFLTNNLLSGTMPTELGQLQLTALTLSTNAQTGSIPSEYGNLKDLTLLAMGDNGITGSIPTQLGRLKNLTDLGIWCANLTGTMPSELGELTSLVSLMLAKNKLSGTLPSEVGRFSDLFVLFLSNNKLRGTIPSEMGVMKSLISMNLALNSFSGSIPSQIGSLSILETLDMAHNQLSGTIPPQLGLSKTLLELTLESNRLTGTIPSSLGLLLHTRFSWIETAAAGYDEFPEIFYTALPNWSINLGRNRLTGTIPSELGMTKHVLRLLVQENLLTGTIPKELGMLSNVGEINLSSNDLTGSIFSELSQLSGLEVLNIHSNGIAGLLPSQLGILPSLSNLNAADNALTGTIPLELATLASRSGTGSFNVTGTGLSGTLPEAFCAANASFVAFDCSAKLCGCDCPC